VQAKGMNDSVNLTGLARQIVEAGLLDEKKTQDALQQAKRNQVSLVTWLVQNKLVQSRVLMELASLQFGLVYLDLNAVNPEFFPKELVNEKLAHQHRVLPLYQRVNKLYVAVSDPSSYQALRDLQFSTGMTIEQILVEDDKLGKAIDKLYESAAGTLDGMDDAELDGLRLENTEATGPSQNDETDETPVVRFVNKMLLDAIKSGSSDLHFEPYEKVYRVRFRTDGILHEVARPPIQLRDRISARLKIMASMDISERRKPQDGRIKLKVTANKSIDFRVNTLPTLWGEKIVMRILDSSSLTLGIDALGYEDDQKQLYLDALAQPHGLILVTGPTGSGKTVSLYTGLSILNTEGVNISTVEDPVEINLEGVNQVSVNQKQGMDFTTALRAFLRQDPDVIMVGEIRDLETAEIAIKAAQTGHLVLSTLHTNSAAETLNRLRNMGVASFNLATSLSLIIAQRLARKLCSCKQAIDVPNELLLKEGFSPEQIGTFTLYEAKGCDNCHAGYKGRVGIYEVVKNTPELQRVIMADGNAIDISAQMRKDGFNSLRTSGLLKVVHGITSLAEVNRVTKD
jgi:type IV pilus assembly protein PilB